MTMPTQCAMRPPMKRGEEGYVLVAVIFLLALLVMSLAIAIPKVKASIQRDREIETMHRGKQYARAIKLYYKKFNAYPPNVEALVKTNEIRFLRKRYLDPMTGKDDWRPIHFGENKTPMALGFFGQSLGGDAVAGTGPSGGNGIAGASPIGGTGGIFSDSGSGGTNGTTGTNGSGTGTTGSSSTFGSSTTGTGSGSGSGTDSSSGQTFGGAGIVGFAPGVSKESILLYKKKNHYNEWEFLYSPLADQQGMGSSNTGTIGSPVAGPDGGTNTTPGGSSILSGGGSSGTTTPTGTTTPQ